MWSQIVRRAAVLTFIGLLGQVAIISPAAAHAVIVASAPAVHDTVAAGDVKILLRYNVRIDHARSRLTLVSADGVAHVLPIAADSPPDMVASVAPGLGAGEYRLRWQVLAIDGHLTRGDIPFSVKAP
jgi:methionine-rich copper-binding protein CopC